LSIYFSIDAQQQACRNLSISLSQFSSTYHKYSPKFYGQAQANKDQDDRCCFAAASTSETIRINREARTQSIDQYKLVACACDL
jgi:hypothetical protein